MSSGSGKFERTVYIYAEKSLDIEYSDINVAHSANYR